MIDCRVNSLHHLVFTRQLIKTMFMTCTLFYKCLLTFLFFGLCGRWTKSQKFPNKASCSHFFMGPEFQTPLLLFWRIFFLKLRRKQRICTTPCICFTLFLVAPSGRKRCEMNTKRITWGIFDLMEKKGTHNVWVVHCAPIYFTPTKKKKKNEWILRYIMKDREGLVLHLFKK